MKELLGKLPIYGVSLGMQIVSLALGCKTTKLKYGHRGSNHPIMNLETEEIIVSAQNHSYAVDCETMPSNVKVIYKNINDNTVEGISCEEYNVKAVQFDSDMSFMTV